MERKDIRGALACLALAADVNEDEELATILNVVHAAILHNDAHRLCEHLGGYEVLVHQHDRRKQMSSTHSAVCGNSVDTGAPHCP